MLTKYTATIYILFPILLAIFNKNLFKDRRRFAVFISVSSLGFSWWIYIFIRFGSIAPVEFLGINGEPFKSPYILSLMERQWYHPWLYLIFICPLIFLYFCVGSNYLMKVLRNKASVFFNGNDTAFLFIVNVVSIISVIIFCIANSLTNGYWIMRHNMPFYPIMYITIGVMVSNILNLRNRIINAYLVVTIFVTYASMSISTFITILNVRGLKPIPAILFWIPGLKTLFH